MGVANCQKTVRFLAHPLHQKFQRKCYINQIYCVIMATASEVKVFMALLIMYLLLLFLLFL